MSSLLDAVNVAPTKIEVTDKLPECTCDISIMTIGDLFNELDYLNSRNTSEYHYDPNDNYYTSKYYVFGIAYEDGENVGISPSIDYLRDIILGWDGRHNELIVLEHAWRDNDICVFGGPLSYVHCFMSDKYNELRYGFHIYWREREEFDTDPKFWSEPVPSSTYVAVVCVH